jgi:hypothetical protein
MSRLVSMGLVMSLGLGGIAAAQPSTPSAPVCTDGGRLQRAHEMGRRQGASLVESAWDTVDRDCAQRARLERVVHQALDRRSAPAGASETSRCRDSGFRAGALEALAHVAAACTGK